MRLNNSDRPAPSAEMLDMIRYLVVLNSPGASISINSPLSGASDQAIQLAIKRVKCEQARRLSRVTFSRFDRNSLSNPAIGILSCFNSIVRSRATLLHSGRKRTEFRQLFKRLHTEYKEDYLEARRNFKKQRGRRWMTSTDAERTRQSATKSRTSSRN